VKKAQLYLFAAIILIVLAFTLATSQIARPEDSGVFQQLVTNFKTQAPIALNQAVYGGTNVSQAFVTFTQDYAEYARTRDPAFGFIAMYSRDDEIMIINTLQESADVLYGSLIRVDTEARIPYKGSSLTIRYHGIDYELSIERSLSLRAVFISQTKERVNVHVMEE